MNKLVLIISIMLAGITHSHAQSWGDSSFKKRLVFIKTEIAPQFPGGDAGLKKFVKEHSTIPVSDYATARSKLVLAELTLDSTGKVAFARIIQGADATHNNAAIEVIKQMPLWKPARQNGRDVSIIFLLPFYFKN